MAESQVGAVAVVWALPETTATGTGIGTFTPQSLTFAREAERATIKDHRGQDKVNIFYNRKNRLTLEVMPSGATLAAAKAANVCPKPGTQVTVVTDDSDTEADGTHTGKYICISSSKTGSNADAYRISMELEQVEDEDISTTISA